MNKIDIPSQTSPPKHLVDAWTKVLNDMGPETVRMRLCNGELRSGPNMPVKFARVFVKDRPFVPSRTFVDDWLACEDRKVQRRSSMQNVLIWIGAGSAVIGAVTGIMSVLDMKP